jgi:hypothetical protein
VQGIFDSSGWDDVDARVREHIGRLGTIYSVSLHDGDLFEGGLVETAF